MSKINFPKKQEQRLIPKYLLEYAEELQEKHPDPSASWGGGSGGEYTAGTGIDITANVISVDDTVAMKTDIPDVSDFVTSTELSTELEDYELKSEAFSGSYSDLSNKPDLTVYELKSDAFTGDYDDLTNKPDLSVYELKTDAFSGDYNDLTNKPTIPDAVSGTNDGTNWTTITIGNTTKNIPTGGSTYTAGTWIGITNDTINVSNPYISLLDSNNIPRVMISDTTNGTTPSFSARYCNISPTGFGINDRTKPQPTGGPSSNTYTYYNWDKITFDGTWDLALPTKSGTIAVTSDIPTIPTNISAFTNDSGYITGIDSSMVITALGYTPGTSDFSGNYNDLANKPDLSIYAETSDLATVATTGDYDDLSNKPTIPVVPTNVSAFTNDAGYITSSAIPTNYVTTDTDQYISGAKTFDNIIYGRRNNQTTSYRIYNDPTDGLGIGVYSSDGSTRTYYKFPNYTTASTKTVATTDDITTALTSYTPTSSLATVATTGSYNDLSNKPSIPTRTTIYNTTPTSGTTLITSFELTDVITNYDEIEVYFCTNDSTTMTSILTAEAVSGALINLHTVNVSATYGMYIKYTQFQLGSDNKTFSQVRTSEGRLYGTNQTQWTQSTTQTHCRPYKVVGIKY